MGLFACFLMLAAGQDLNRKEVELWVYLLFGGAALAAGIGRQAAGGGDYRWTEHFGGICLGLGLLGLSVVSRGGIGTGDGCFFVVSGLFVGFRENLLMLLYGTLFCGLFSLIYFVSCRVRNIANAGKCTVPFLPFVVPPGVWVVMQNWKSG